MDSSRAVIHLYLDARLLPFALLFTAFLYHYYFRHTFYITVHSLPLLVLSTQRPCSLTIQISMVLVTRLWRSSMRSGCERNGRAQCRAFGK